MLLSLSLSTYHLVALEEYKSIWHAYSKFVALLAEQTTFDGLIPAILQLLPNTNRY